MYEIAIVFAVTVLGVILVPNVIISFEKLIVKLDELEERRKRKKKLRHDIKAWTIIAMNYDSVTEAYDKGYAIARLTVLYHELDVMEWKRVA